MGDMSKLSIIDNGFLLTESQNSPKHVACLQIFRLPKGRGSAWLRRLLDDLQSRAPRVSLQSQTEGQQSFAAGMGYGQPV